MEVLKNVGPSHDTVEEAEDSLNGIAAVQGYLFGYVEKKNKRCVTYLMLSPIDPIPGKNQEVVDIDFNLLAVGIAQFKAGAKNLAEV